MTIIRSILKGSGGQLLSATLDVTLDNQIVNTNTSPDTIFFPLTQTYTINNGVLDINLIPSKYVTYSFRLYQRVPDGLPTYWFSDGTQYQGVVHQLDGVWYTGAVHAEDSKIVGRIEQYKDNVLISFRAVVPDTDKVVNFSDLIPSGITTDTLDTSVMRLAEIIASDPVYQNALRPVVVVCPNSPVADSNLGLNQANFWIDSSNNVLRVKIKKADGTIANGGIAIT